STVPNARFSSTLAKQRLWMLFGKGEQKTSVRWFSPPSVVRGGLSGFYIELQGELFSCGHCEWFG
ncbi:MAG: hypothetical protein L7W43_20820, partial [Rubripirellula sp.]|nr:hypothetical protein [Rubripirellula sp.]